MVDIALIFISSPENFLKQLFIVSDVKVVEQGSEAESLPDAVIEASMEIKGNGTRLAREFDDTH